MESYKDQDEIFSNKIRAGKRTYFFDVRATKANDYYLTITESKKYLTMMVVTTLKNTKYFSTKKILKNSKILYHKV